MRKFTEEHRQNDGLTGIRSLTQQSVTQIFNSCFIISDLVLEGCGSGVEPSFYMRFLRRCAGAAVELFPRAPHNIMRSHWN